LSLPYNGRIGDKVNRREEYMNKHILVTITSALVLTCGALGAVAEE
jgi:hypothetical protein